MADTSLNINFSTIEPFDGSNARRMFPVSDSRGWLVQIINEKSDENGNKNGTVLTLELQGLEGPVNGKIMDWTFNTANPSQSAVEFSHRQLSAIAHVVGHVQVNRVKEWFGRPFRVVIEIDPKADQEKYPNSTRVAKILDINGNGPKAAGQGVMGAAQQGNAQSFAPTNSSAPNGGNGSPVAQNGGGSWNGGAQQAPVNNQPVQNFQPVQQQSAPAQQFQGQPQGNFQQQPAQQFQQTQGGAGPGWNQ